MGQWFDIIIRIVAMPEYMFTRSIYFIHAVTSADNMQFLILHRHKVKFPDHDQVDRPTTPQQLKNLVINLTVDYLRVPQQYYQNKCIQYLFSLIM